MKKQFFFLVLLSTALALGSCKKTFTCVCSDPNNGSIIIYDGPIEATSASAAASQAENKYTGSTCTCN